MKKLKEKRKKAKFTLQTLGEKVGLNYKTIYQYETDKREPSIQTLKKLAQIFDCTVDELID